MFAQARDFCTCADLECKLHPTNHDQGCGPCVKVNLAKNEIPSCFFNKVTGGDREVVKKGTEFERFADIVIAAKKNPENK